MDELLWLLTDGADWESLILLPLNTLIARRLSFHNADACHVIPVGAGVDQRLPEVEAILVHVLARFLVVECINNQVKIFEEMEAESLLLDPTKVCINFYMFVLVLDLLLQH